MTDETLLAEVTAKLTAIAEQARQGPPLELSADEARQLAATIWSCLLGEISDPAAALDLVFKQPPTKAQH